MIDISIFQVWQPSDDSCSRQSYNDPDDHDYVPPGSETEKPRITLSTYLPCTLDDIAPELERDSAGAESQARTLTAFCGALHKSGLLKQKYVVTRSKIEGAKKRDGTRRIDELAKCQPKGLQKFT